MRTSIAALATCAALAAITVPSATAGSTADPDPLAPDALMSTVVAYSGLAPHHRTGAAAEQRTQSWLKRQLRQAGARVGEDAYRFPGFFPRRVRLKVAGLPRTTDVVAQLYSGRTAPQGLRLPLADAGGGAAREYAGSTGRIAVISLPVVAGLVVGFDRAVDAAEDAGAAGLVVVTKGAGDAPVHVNVDARTAAPTLPTLLVGKTAGAAVVAAAKSGRRAKLVLRATVRPGCDRVVYGVLPGAPGSRLLVVGTPTSAWVRSASERGAGVAVLLGLARHFGRLPVTDRPYTLVFAGFSGHEVGFLGLPSFMQAHPAWFERTDAYLHLGASIAALASPSSGQSAVGDPTRALYVSENPLLQAVTARTFGAAQPLASIPPAVTNPGEQSQAYARGVPIVGVSGSSEYFHSADDLPSGVGPGLLEGMATAYLDTIRALAALAPGAVRAANGVAEAAAAQADTGPVGHEPTLVEHC